MKKSFLCLFCICFCSSLFPQFYTDPITKKLDSLFNQAKESEPGGYVYVQMGTQIIYYKPFGVSDIQTKQKFDDYTLVNIGGLSRTLISYAVLILQQEGKLNLEDSILKYVPDFKNKEFAKKIKIRHLMTHTSGLKDIPTQKMDSIHFLKITDPENFDLVKYSNTLAFEPGNNFLFSEQGFSLLTMIIEKTAGKAWQDYIREKIFAPAGMTYTKFSAKPGTTTDGAHAYRKIKNIYSEYDEGEVPKMYTGANGTIWSNVGDLRKYLYALQYCLFLKCEEVKLADELLVPFNWYSPHRIPQTYCWYWNEIPNLEYTTLSYEGKIGGFCTDVVRIPQSEVTIVILSNNNTSYLTPIIEALKQFNYIR
jgi:CubicO group peptidase (beta-lactamase class C family)